MTTDRLHWKNIRLYEIMWFLDNLEILIPET
jgi:hypothetical protein